MTCREGSVHMKSCGSVSMWEGENILDIWNKREGSYLFDELGFPQTCNIKTKVWFVACFQGYLLYCRKTKIT